MGAGRTFFYIIGAAGVLIVTYLFFYAIGWFNTRYAPINLEVVTYASTVWIMSGLLAGMIVFAAIAKDHGQLEIVSSLSFLIYTLFAYIIGSSILTLFMPYNGFGSLDVHVFVQLGISGFGSIDATIIYVNTVAALLILLLQALRFLKTLFKAAKVTKEVPAKGR